MEFQYFHPSFSQSAYSSEHDSVKSSTQPRDIFQSRPTGGLYSYNIDQQRDAPTTHSDTSYPQNMGTAVFSMERSEEQIRTELVGIYRTLQRAERYQKYREKQPILTPAEVMERDAADKKERETQEAESVSQNPKDSTVWPDFLEYAFWKALVRWPPMGRRKYMLEGVLKGRNELIQDSIYRDTGIVRDRKQISSHLQVLKAHLKDYPIALAYMGIMEESPKRLRGSITYQPPHLHSLQHSKGINSATEGSSIASMHSWPYLDGAYTGSALDAGSYPMHPSYEGIPSDENFAVPPSLDFQDSMQPGLGLDVPASKGFAMQATNNMELQALSGFDHQGWIDQEFVMSQEGYSAPLAANTNVGGPELVACYSTQPESQQSNLVTRLENVAEQYQTYVSNENHCQVQQSRAAIHDGYHERAAQREGPAECGVFNAQGTVNHFIWDSQDVHYPS